jgi:YHS domain-containing protein
MIRRLTVVTVLGFVLASGQMLLAEEKKGDHKDTCNDTPQDVQAVVVPKCPVSGEAVNLYVSLATDDGPVYFCCPDCIAKYKANPKDYAEKVTAQRAALEKLERVQVTCPVSGEPVNEKVFTEKGGKKVYFCCKDCQAKYEADPAAYKAKLAGSYTYQTHCPVMGEPIDPKSFSDLPGKQRVYFCCMACEKKILAEPEKYAPKMAAQGYKLDVEKIKKGASEKKGDAKADDQGAKKGADAKPADKGKP